VHRFNSLTTNFPPKIYRRGEGGCAFNGDNQRMVPMKPPVNQSLRKRPSRSRLNGLMVR
jgi:hypothetical protein